MKSGIYAPNGVLNLSRVCLQHTVTIDTVAVEDVNNYSDNPSDEYQTQYSSINITATGGGNNTIVTGTGSMEVYVDSYNLQASNLVTFKFLSGTGVIIGPFTLASGDFAEADDLCLKTNAGESLVIYCSASGLNGHLTYHTI